jgi:hypothetical protein
MAMTGPIYVDENEMGTPAPSSTERGRDPCCVFDKDFDYSAALIVQGITYHSHLRRPTIFFLPKRLSFTRDSSDR